jgi:hypothetical protein
MKALLSFLAVALILAATATADWVVESRVEDPDGNVTSVNKVKADKIRYDMPKGPIGPVSTIFDAASGDWIIIMHGLKTFQKQSAAQMKRGMDAIWSGPDVKSADTPKYKATGEKGKVGDFDCEIYAATDQRLTFRVWVATSHPQAAVLKAIDKLNTRFLPSRALDYSTLPGVVLKTEMDLEGKKTTVTVVSVKEQDLDAREFEAPAGYQSMPDSGLPSASRGSAPATKPSPQAAAMQRPAIRRPRALRRPRASRSRSPPKPSPSATEPAFPRDKCRPMRRTISGSWIGPTTRRRSLRCTTTSGISPACRVSTRFRCNIGPAT